DAPNAHVQRRCRRRRDGGHSRDVRAMRVGGGGPRSQRPDPVARRPVLAARGAAPQRSRRRLSRRARSGAGGPASADDRRRSGAERAGSPRRFRLARGCHRRATRIGRAPRAVVRAHPVRAREHRGPLHGRDEARHPLLWVDTDNNMVADRGTTAIRYAPAPERFDLTNVSREAVMDAHAWSYRVAAQEMVREGKIREDAAAGSGLIPDPRRFVYVEACTELRNAAVAFSIRAADRDGRDAWYDSDRGVPEFRIARTG